MFFAAEREQQQKRRRKSEELVGQLSFTEETGLQIGEGQPVKTPVKPLDTIYPGFTSTRLGDVLRIVTDIEADEHKPLTKKQRVQGGVPGDVSTGSTLSYMNKPLKNLPPAPRSFDELVKVFPQLQTILAEQQQKLESRRVSDQYIHEVEKPKLALPQLSQPVVESKKEEVGTWQPNFAVDTTKPQEPPPHPTGISGSAPVNAGGGLLSGIDDLFGSPKKKTRSKRR